jgi:hypothetical protein
MPTVLKIGDLRVTIYTNDHRPPHVHVIGTEHEAVFKLNCPEGPPELRENYGFSRYELSRIAEQLSEELTALCHRWDQIHGTD